MKKKRKKRIVRMGFSSRNGVFLAPRLRMPDVIPHTLPELTKERGCAGRGRERGEQSGERKGNPDTRRSRQQLRGISLSSLCGLPFGSSCIDGRKGSGKLRLSRVRTAAGLVEGGGLVGGLLSDRRSGVEARGREAERWNGLEVIKKGRTMRGKGKFISFLRLNLQIQKTSDHILFAFRCGQGRGGRNGEVQGGEALNGRSDPSIIKLLERPCNGGCVKGNQIGVCP